MFNKLPNELLMIIYTKLPREKRYKFFLINRECRFLYPRERYKSLFYGNRCKFYQLVKITLNWKSEYDLNKINFHYKSVEDCYNVFNRDMIKYGNKTKWCSDDRKKKSFDDYFHCYVSLCEKKDDKIIKEMFKYGVII